MADAALRADRVRRAFGGVQAVADVSLHVAPGEVVGLLGPNGAGKTTTLRMLAGILTPDDGDVTVCGIRMRDDPLAAKRRIGFLSGDTQLYQRLTPREVLAYFGKLYDLRSPALDEAVERVVRELGMQDFAGRPCGTLSSGQKQRANIARAFLHAPDVLILDEPTNALDVASGRFIADSIRRARTDGRAVLLSTHIISEAEYLCDRIYVMARGALCAEGPTRALLDSAGKDNLTDAFLALVGEG